MSKKRKRRKTTHLPDITVKIKRIKYNEPLEEEKKDKKKKLRKIKQPPVKSSVTMRQVQDTVPAFHISTRTQRRI